MTGQYHHIETPITKTAKVIATGSGPSNLTPSASMPIWVPLLFLGFLAAID